MFTFNLSLMRRLPGWVKGEHGKIKTVVVRVWASIRDAREGKFTFSGEFRRITPIFLSVVSFFFRRGHAVSYCYVFFCRRSLK